MTKVKMKMMIGAIALSLAAPSAAVADAFSDSFEAFDRKSPVKKRVVVPKGYELLKEEEYVKKAAKAKVKVEQEVEKKKSSWSRYFWGALAAVAKLVVALIVLL